MTMTMPRGLLASLGMALMISSVSAQSEVFDLLIKNGHVIDPREGLNSQLDIGIQDGRIVAVRKGLPAAQANQVVDARGMYVTPGLIDIHVHAFHGTDPDAYLSNGPSALPPDGFTLRHGVTTAVDAGGAGWRNFQQFEEQVIRRARVRLLAFLNIVGSGMKGGPAEQRRSDMDPIAAAGCIVSNRDLLVGIKVAHYQGSDWVPVDAAVQAGRLTNVPVMVDFGRHEPELSLDQLLNVHLRPGDILTHTYANVSGRLPVVGDDGKVRDYVWNARRRGVLFDVGHGAGSFLFSQAVPALAQQFLPDIISTDLHTGSMNGGMKDMLNVMSKFLNMGVRLEDVVRFSTWEPAQAIHRTDLGHLGAGATADLAVLSLLRGNFGFIDTAGKRLGGNRKLECELTIREGEILWDLNGISKENWNVSR